MKEYNLSIYAVDCTIFGCISKDVEQLKRFLKQYDHEGASINLVVRLDNGGFVTIDAYEDILRELGELGLGSKEGDL